MKDAAKKAGIIILAMFFSAGAFGFFGMESSYDTVLYFLVSYAMYGLLFRAKEVKDRRVIIASLIFSMLLTFTFAVGHQVSEEKPYFPSLSLLDWAYLLPFAGLIYVCILNLIEWVLHCGFEFDASSATIKYWRNVFLVIVALWLPYFLAFYPGNLSWDSIDSVEQVMGRMAWSNWHPVLFTAMVGLFMKIGMLFGDINFGIACFTLAQMLVFAAILSYHVFWMRKKGVPSWIGTVTAAFFALNPLIATYAITMWKDVLFSAFLLLLIMLLYDIVESGGKILSSFQGLLRLAVIYLVVAFFRNNGIYILALVTILIIICYRKYWKSTLLVCIPVLGMIFLIQGPVYDAMGIGTVNFAESAGILLQQIAYTLEQNGNVDADSLTFLNQILPIDSWSSVYVPTSADAIKFNENFNNGFFNANSGEFLKIWFELLPENFGYYVKAWLMNTLGYFHIGTIETPYWYGIIPLEQVDAMQIYRTDLLAKMMGTDIVASVIEAFLFFLKDLPVFNALYSIAVSVWITALSAVTLILRKTGKWILPLVPLVALWGTMMVAAPVHCEFRYMFAFHLALPLILTLLLRRERSRSL